MLPASVQGLGLGRPVNRRSLNGNYRSVATSPRADESFRQNIKNKWLRALVLTLTNPKLWYVLTGLLGSAWIVMSLFYVPSLLLMGDYSDLSEGMYVCTPILCHTPHHYHTATEITSFYILWLFFFQALTSSVIKPTTS